MDTVLLHLVSPVRSVSFDSLGSLLRIRAVVGSRQGQRATARNEPAPPVTAGPERNSIALPGCPASVYRPASSADEIGLWRSEKQHHVRDLFGLAPAAERKFALRKFGELRIR